MKKIFTRSLVLLMALVLTGASLNAQTNCPPPISPTVTGVTSVSAQLGWTTTFLSTYFIVEYRLAGSATWSQVTVQQIPFTLSGLNCSATYEWRVIAVCTSSSTGVTVNSSPAAGPTFTTLACNNACLAPTGLTASNVTQSSATISWSSISTTGLFNVQYTAAGTTQTVTMNNVSSPVNITGLSCNTPYIFQVQAICINPNGVTTLSPWSAPFTVLTHACQNTCPAPINLSASNISASGAVLSWTANTTIPSSFNLRYRITTSTAWNNVNNVSSPWQLGGLICNTTYVWQVQNVCFSSSGTTTLSPWSALHTFTAAACPVVCPAPAGLTTTNISGNSATLNWNTVAGAGAYQVRYRQAGSLAWMYVTATTNSKVLVNLICGIHYQWQVRAHCSPASNVFNNPWSSTASFTTLICNTTCLPPTTLTNGNITSTTADLAWTSTGAPVYRVRYRPLASGLNWYFQSTTATMITLTGLMPLTVYEWQVQSWCSPGTNAAGSPWSVALVFTTLQGPTNNCGIPGGLAATAVSQGGALLTWNTVAGASSYTVRYKQVNSTIPFVSATTVTNMLQVGNLLPGTAYEWQVLAICPGANGTVIQSAWSPLSYFTTPLLLVIYPNPANDFITIAYESTADSEIVIQFRDLFGKIVSTEIRQASKGSNNFFMNTDGIHDGWYSVTVNSITGVHASRLLIQR